MAEKKKTTKKTAVKGGATGTIVRIVGAVIDVEFDPDDMPAIYNALHVEADTEAGHIDAILEVQTHLKGDMVRCVAMTSTDGLTRGLKVVDTGAPIQMPVGDNTLGRIWNVLGEPVDGKPMPKISDHYPIHHEPPSYDTLTTETEKSNSVFSSSVTVIGTLLVSVGCSLFQKLFESDVNDELRNFIFLLVFSGVVLLLLGAFLNFVPNFIKTARRFYSEEIVFAYNDAIFKQKAKVCNKVK